MAAAFAVTTVVVRGQRPAARDAAALETRILQGQVRSDDDSAALLRRVKVTVVSGGGGAPVFTDQEGRFAIVVPARQYTVRISKPGFATQHVQRTPDGRDQGPLLQVLLARGAAINGRVLDELGAPVADARVSVRSVPTGNGSRGGVLISTTALTDDLGEFRAGSLPGGSYRLAVESMPSFNAFVAGTGGAGPPAGPQSAVPVNGRATGPVPGAMPAVIPASPSPPRPGPGQAGGRNQAGTANEPSPIIVQVRAGEEADVTIARNRAALDYREASSFVAGYEAAARSLDPFTRLSPRGTADISGRVTDPNGRGVAGAIVRLNPVSPGTPKLTASDPNGSYRFSFLPAGSYRVSATRNGLLGGEHGQERAGQPGTVVTLRDRQRRDRVDVGLRRGASISGIVTDADGEVIEGLAMHAWRLEYRGGRPVTESVARVRRTDDHGRYRIHGLQPGTYYVVASDDQSPTETIESVMRAERSFYPGTTTVPLATPVVVDVGVDAAGIDMVYTPSRTVRVSGQAMNSFGGPLNRSVALVGRTRSGMPAPAAQMASMNGFSFEFPHVPPGEYAIQALHDWRDVLEQPLPAEFTAQLITIGDEDVRGIALLTTPGSTVRGRIVKQGGGRPAVSGNWLSVATADPDFEPASTLPRPWTTTIYSDLTFSITGLTGPIRFSSTQDLVPTLWLKSADMGGANLADEPAFFNRRDETNTYVEVVLAGDGAQVSGRVVDGRKEPVGSYVVVAFPIERGRWYNGSRYIRLAKPDDRAQFTLPMLPPGDFWIVAVDALEETALQNPEVLVGLSASARRIALSPGETMTMELPLVRMRR